MISVINQKSIMAEARGILAKSRRSSKKALAIFDLRYSNDKPVANSIFHISGQTGVKQQSVRLMIKNIWKAICTTDRAFCEQLYIDLYKSIDTSTGYAVNLNRLIEANKLDQNFVHIISDMLAYGLQEEIIRVSHPFTMRVLRRADRFHLVYASGLKIMEDKSRKNSIKSIKRLEVKEYIDSLGDTEGMSLSLVLKNAALALGSQGELFVKRTGLEDPSTAEISLQEQGDLAGGITRERVRQICEGVMQSIMFAEQAAGKGPITKIKAVALNQAARMKLNKEPIMTAEAMIESNVELHCFRDNLKGFYLICRYAGIELIKKKNGFWFVPTKVGEKMLQQKIKGYHAKAVMLRSKPVIKCGLTKVMPDIIAFVKAESERMPSLSMNEYYVQCAAELMASSNNNEPIPYEKVDWHNADCKMVNVRFEGAMLDKIDKIVAGTAGAYSRADFLLTAIHEKVRYEKSKSSLQVA